MIFKFIYLFIYLFIHNFATSNRLTMQKTQLYKALVHPKLDCCSCVWDPPSITLLDKLEPIQGFAANLYMKWCMVPSTLFTSDLNLPTLYSHRSWQKVLLCRHIITNKSIISPSSHFSPPPHPNPRTHHPHTVQVPFARTACFHAILPLCIHL